jgi:hypothetical protein
MERKVISPQIRTWCLSSTSSHLLADPTPMLASYPALVPSAKIHRQHGPLRCCPARSRVFVAWTSSRRLEVEEDKTEIEALLLEDATWGGWGAVYPIYGYLLLTDFFLRWIAAPNATFIHFPVQRP